MEALEVTARKRAKKGLPTPLYDEQPHPYPDLQSIWRAFTDLSSRRRCGFAGEDPIQFSEIMAWLELNEIDRRRWRDYVEPIQSLDRVYMKESEKARPKK
jgi:hypothetical protein